VATVTVGVAGAQRGAFGANLSAGIAMDNRGNAMLFATSGASMGAGAAATTQIGVQSGNLTSVIAPTFQGGGYSMTGSIGPGSGTVQMNDDGTISGGGGGATVGAGLFLNTTAGGVGLPISPVASIRETVKMVNDGWEQFKRDAYRAMIPSAAR
jgi:hypothetical protein